MKVRPSSSFMSVDESMKYVLEIPDWESLIAFLAKELRAWRPDSMVLVEKYGSGIDKRIGWDTHLISVDGNACLFSDGPMEPPPGYNESRFSWEYVDIVRKFATEHGTIGQPQVVYLLKKLEDGARRRYGEKP